MQKQEIDVNKVIDNLTNQIAKTSRDMAVLQAQIDSLRDVVDKQQEMIDAYEDKEEITEKGATKK